MAETEKESQGTEKSSREKIFDKAREIIRERYEIDVPYDELQTVDLLKFWDKTGNLYKSVFVVGKRAAQIHRELTTDLRERIKAMVGDAEIVSEAYQKDIEELARVYEAAPDPILIALEEFMNDKTYFKFMEDRRKGRR